MFRESGIGHPSSWRYYYVANSLMGLWWIYAVQHKKTADRDIRRTKDGVLVVVHGSPEHLTPLPIEQMLFKDVIKYSRNGLGITSLQRQFEWVAQNRKRFRRWVKDPAFKIEPKHPWTIRDAADVAQLKRWEERYGVRCTAYVLRQNDYLRSNKTRQSALLDQGGIPCDVIG